MSDLSGDERNARPASDAEGVDDARRALTVLHCTRPSRRSALGVFWRGFPEVVPGAKQRAALDRELRAIFASAARGDEPDSETTKKTETGLFSFFVAEFSSVAASRALFVALTLTVLGQLSAGPVIQYFPKHIFELAGHVASDDGGAARAREPAVTAASLTVWTSVFKVVATGTVAVFVDRYGRRFFFAFGVTAQLAACIVLALAFGDHGWDEDARGVRLPPRRARLADASVFLCLVGFQAGFASLTSPIIADISPMRARTSIMAISAFLNWALSSLLTWTFPKVQDEPGIRVMFLAYAAVLAFSLFFVARFVPETTGRSLEEVELALAKSASLAGAVRALSAHVD